MKKYSKPFDWPSYLSAEDIERNVKEIINKNEQLKMECQKYKFELINTSRGNNRNIVLSKLVNKIENE